MPGVDPVILLSPGTHILQVSAHLNGGLCHLGQVRVFKTEIPNRLFHLGIQERIAAASLILGQNAGPIQRDPFGSPHFDQQVRQTEREEMAARPLQRRRHIRNPKRNPTTSSSCMIVLIKRGSATIKRLSSVNLISRSVSG